MALSGNGHDKINEDKFDHLDLETEGSRDNLHISLNVKILVGFKSLIALSCKT